MRILLLTHSFNSLTQRLFVELTEKNHIVSVEFDVNDAISLEAINLFQPDIIIAPFLKRAIPETIWRKYCCLIVHPGIRGDRGPSALDWAILENEASWGVTVLQATAEMDAGDIWAYAEFPLRNASKASLYRNEVTEAAAKAVLDALDNFIQKEFKPQPLDYQDKQIKGCLRPSIKQNDRQINWQKDNTETIVRKIRSADGYPGMLDQINGRSLYLYDAHAEYELEHNANPGQIIARQGLACCRATIDGAVWLGHLCDKESKHPFKLPAAMVLNDADLNSVPLIEEDVTTAYQEVWYEQYAGVGYLHFPFYNGAMSTRQCQLLRKKYQEAVQQDTRVIVLMGGTDFWSNGIHLNVIEAAESPADESWNNINAIDDLACDIINTDSHITVSAMQGNAGAGGVFLALAADHVIARSGIVMNPHYKDMGNLYGSEYWTYLLPQRVDKQQAQKIIETRLPMGTREALRLGLINKSFGKDSAAFTNGVRQYAENLATMPDYVKQFRSKKQMRAMHEEIKPLARYRDEELERMRLNFYGFDPSYHVARYNFVYKISKSRTPITIARHRDIHWRDNNIIRSVV
jgi:putative two-component system protein, hydrogenase maturation factor HypX/HoxX